MNKYAQVTYDGKKSFFIRIDSENDRFITGIEVAKDGDEITPRGRDAEGNRFTERRHMIEKTLVTAGNVAIIPAAMNNRYGELEIDNSR